MAIDSDNRVSLPTPPPPRPAARRDAIDAAMRKFDGVDEPPERAPAKSWWASHQRQLGAIATAAIIAVVSVPIALDVASDQQEPKSLALAPPAGGSRSSPQAASDEGPMPPIQPDEAASREVPRTRLPLEPHEEAAAPSSEEGKVENKVPALAVATSSPPAPAPPQAPPPPPPSAPAPEREKAADDAVGQDIVLTGSRIEAPAPSTQHGRLAAKRAADAASPVAVIDAYGQFLSRLQSAVRSGNRGAIVSLMQLPLRVNTSAGPRIYRDRKSVEEDFDQIFTPRVRKSVLEQRSDQLIVRDQGAMVGDGEIWFDQTCQNSNCSKKGPVRVKAVNP